MTYYQLNKNRCLREAKDSYHNISSKDKTAEYYRNNQEVLKEKSRNKYRDLLEQEQGSVKGLWRRSILKYDRK